MALLRRELAFIKSDYRNIVVAYYTESKSVRDIASSLSLRSVRFSKDFTVQESY